MTKVVLTPDALEKLNCLELKVLQSGNRIILMGSVDIETFDKILAHNSEFEDFEEDGHTEAEETTDGYSA